MSATAIDPNVVATGGFSFTTTEGAASISATVTTFTTPCLHDALPIYSATINWGDGSTSLGVITETAGVFTVSGTHTYSGDTIPGGSGESEGTATIITTADDETTAA